jgi:hypothetical protein
MNTKEWPEIFSRVEKSRKAENKKAHSMNAKLIFSLSWLAAVTLTASPVNAAPRRGGGGHGHGHMSMPSRGGATFSRGGNRSGRNWSGRNWSGRNWSGGNWSGRNWSGGNQFIFTGGFGSPFVYGYPSYGYYPYGYYGNQGYGYGNQGYGYYGNQGYGNGNQGYGYYGNQGYGYGNGNQGYRYGNQRQEQKGQIRERSRRHQSGR